MAYIVIVEDPGGPVGETWIRVNSDDSIEWISGPREATGEVAGLPKQRINVDEARRFLAQRVRWGEAPDAGALAGWGGIDPPPQPAAPTPIPSAPAPSGRAVLESMLNEWGLGGLAGWAWQKVTQGVSNEQLVVELRQTAEYKQRFQGLAARQKKGLPAISEAAYLAYENQARQVMRAYGLPPGFYDQPEDFANYIAEDVSIAELNERIQTASDLYLTEPPETRAEFTRLFGMSPGDGIAYFLDPDRALPVLQTRMRNAQIAGTASRMGIGSLSEAEAGRIGELAPTGFEEGLANMAALQGVTSGTVGEGTDIDRGTTIEAVFGGNEQARQQITRRQRQRQAKFSGGGTFTASSGRTGIGQAE